MASHRYWRVQAKSVQSGTNFGFAEVQMRIVSGGADQTAPQTAPSAIVLASSQFNTTDHKKENAFDDDNATWWATATGAHIDGWIGYDFGTAVEIVEVTLRSRADTGFFQSALVFIIAGSDDGVTWTDYKRHTTTTWTAGLERTFAVPLTPDMGAARVHGLSMEVLHSSPGNLRVNGLAIEVLRTISDVVVGGRRRIQQTG